MKNFSYKIQAINFKKAFIIFFTAMLVFAVASVSYLAVTYQNLRPAITEFNDIARGDKTLQGAEEQKGKIDGMFPSRAGMGRESFNDRFHGHGPIVTPGRNPHMLWSGNAMIPLRIIAVIGFLFCVIFRLLLSLWVFVDSKKYNKNTVLWTALTLFTSLFGWVIYLIARGNTVKCDKCGMRQSAANQFCVKCGNNLKTMCVSCNTTASGGDIYCQKCGQAIKKADSTDEHNAEQP